SPRFSRNSGRTSSASTSTTSPSLKYFPASLSTVKYLTTLRTFLILDLHGDDPSDSRRPSGADSSAYARARQLALHPRDDGARGVVHRSAGLGRSADG